MKLGARILKTGLVVILALYICEWFHLEPAFVVVIAAVITTQPSVYRSYKHLLDQVQGNTIGAALGFFAVSLLGNHPILIGLIVIAVIAANLLLKLESSIVLSIITVVIVMDEPSSAINRFLLILTGVVLAMVINTLFFPPNHQKSLLEKLRDLNEHLLLLMRNSLEQPFDNALLKKEKETIESELKKTKDLYHLYYEERMILPKERKQKPYKLALYRQMIEVYDKELQILKCIRKEGKEWFGLHLADHLNALSQYHEIIFLRFEGKLKATASHQKNLKIAEENRHLFEDLMEQDKDLNASELRPIMLVALLTDLAEQLDHLDTLVTSYRRFHE